MILYNNILLIIGVYALFFQYGDVEIEHLKKRDKKLASVIDRLGYLERPVSNDIFSSIIRHIIGQQISTQAQVTIWNRLLDITNNNVCVESVSAINTNDLQQLGMSFRKVEYIQNFTDKVASNHLDIDALHNMCDDDVIKTLSSLNGIGVWTAEMLLLFTMQRPNILSYGDLAIIRGMRMLYRHKKIDKKLFAKYAKRYSPYGSVASIYLWAIAGGAIPELTDPANKK